MGTEKTVSMTTLLLLVVLSAILGSVLTKLYYEMQLSDLQSAKIKVERENDGLIVQRAQLTADLTAAEDRAEKARQRAYSGSIAARAWADADVPAELSERVRRAAAIADSAATAPDTGAGRREGR